MNSYFMTLSDFIIIIIIWTVGLFWQKFMKVRSGTEGHIDDEMKIEFFCNTIKILDKAHFPRSPQVFHEKKNFILFILEKFSNFSWHWIQFGCWSLRDDGNNSLLYQRFSRFGEIQRDIFQGQSQLGSLVPRPTTVSILYVGFDWIFHEFVADIDWKWLFVAFPVQMSLSLSSCNLINVKPTMMTECVQRQNLF